jgi:hypothetical protein
LEQNHQLRPRQRSFNQDHRIGDTNSHFCGKSHTAPAQTD